MDVSNKLLFTISNWGYRKRSCRTQTKMKEKHCKNVAEKRKALRNTPPSKLIPSVILFTCISVSKTKQTVWKTHAKKLNSLSREQERPLFNVHDTVKFVDVDEAPPQYVLDTLALGPNNSILDKFNSKEMLAELDLLLKNCKNNNITSEVINDINAATMKYIKSCSKQKSPRNLVMTKKYLTENKLMAVPFDKGIGFCVMKADSYKKKLDDILKLDQFRKEIKPRKNSLRLDS